ncbi:hypothetical protein HDU96_007470 [Phlyctochytrium bullatum]|nr:hypothetical protein HDU96_007470 [Phlyctochytrium bullatum]
MTPLIRTIALLGLLLGLSSTTLAQQQCQGIKKVLYRANNRYLAVEVLSDAVIHFEVSEMRQPPAGPIHVSPMVDAEGMKTRFACGPANFTDDGRGRIDTGAMQISVDTGSLAVTLFDKLRNVKLTTYSYADLTPPQQSTSRLRLQWTKEQAEVAFGIAQAFAYDEAYGSTNGNFMGKQITPPPPFGSGNREGMGNAMIGFYDGAVAYTQLPVAYFANRNGIYQHALFVDSPFKLEWDLRGQTLVATSVGARALRWFAVAGGSLLELRRSYMAVVGYMEVPSRAWLGFHQGLFGYRNWPHLNYEADSLVKANIPIEAFHMDLYWFKGSFFPSGTLDGALRNSRFGSLAWDETGEFPNVKQNVKDIRKKGPGIVLIEEPYLAQDGPTRRFLARSNALVTDCFGCDSTVIGYNPWWGVGGMLDYTSPNVSLWSDCKRCKLFSECQVPPECPKDLESTPGIDELMGIWSDLGEPEMFNEWGRFWGYAEDDGFYHTSHRAINNIYQLLGSKSVYEMHQRKSLRRRPVNYVRSGSPGIQRYGAIMWSGDIPATKEALSNHVGVKKHLIMAGIDLHSSDVGGFHRGPCKNNPSCDLNKLYTAWLANAVWFDTPIKPHTWQTDTSVTASAGIMGHVPSNSFNVAIRYFLLPLYYSLAHNAHRYGDPLLLPMFLRYQKDPNILNTGMGHQIMVGPIMVAHHTESDGDGRRVYFPAGTRWFDFHRHTPVNGTGAYSAVNFPIRIFPDTVAGGITTLPAFVHEGSVFPVSHKPIDSTVRNVDGLELGKVLMLRVYPGPSNDFSRFDVYEDDGETRESAVRDTVAITRVTQTTVGARVEVRVEAVRFGGGLDAVSTPATVAGIPEERPVWIECVMPEGRAAVKSVLVDGVAVGQAASKGAEGWSVGGFGNRVVTATLAEPEPDHPSHELKAAINQKVQEEAEVATPGHRRASSFDAYDALLEKVVNKVSEGMALKASKGEREDGQEGLEEEMEDEFSWEVSDDEADASNHTTKSPREGSGHVSPLPFRDDLDNAIRGRHRPELDDDDEEEDPTLMPQIPGRRGPSANAVPVTTRRGGGSSASRQRAQPPLAGRQRSTTELLAEGYELTTEEHEARFNEELRRAKMLVDLHEQVFAWARGADGGGEEVEGKNDDVEKKKIEADGLGADDEVDAEHFDGHGGRLVAAAAKALRPVAARGGQGLLQQSRSEALARAFEAVSGAARLAAEQFQPPVSDRKEELVAPTLPTVQELEEMAEEEEKEEEKVVAKEPVLPSRTQFKLSKGSAGFERFIPMSIPVFGAVDDDE